MLARGVARLMMHWSEGILESGSDLELSFVNFLPCSGYLWYNNEQNKL